MIFVGNATQNEFDQFKKLSELPNEADLVFDNGQVLLEDGLKPTTVANVLGHFSGFMAAWRHCERTLEAMFNHIEAPL